jgi:hypothetical protein
MPNARIVATLRGGWIAGPPDRVDASKIATPDQVTDTYLVALRVIWGGQLATFDRRLSAKAVHGRKAVLRVIAGGSPRPSH